MGNCCQTGEVQQIINTKDQMFLKKSVSRLNIVNKNLKTNLEKSNPINFDTDKSSFQFYINNLIHKYKIYYNSAKNIKNTNLNSNANNDFIDKVSLEQLWNITKHYEFNHFDNDYVVLDIRLSQEDSFLKHFKQISYKIEEFMTLNHKRLIRLKRFLDNKILLLLVDYYKKSEQLDFFVEMLIKNNFNVTIRIVNFAFEQSNQNDNNNNSNNSNDFFEYSNNNKYFDNQYLDNNNNLTNNATNNNSSFSYSYNNNNKILVNKNNNNNNNNSNNNILSSTKNSTFLRESLNKLFLAHNFDTREFKDLPYILISLKYFNFISSDKMVFFDYYSKSNQLLRHILDNRYTNETLTDKETLENKYFHFCRYFKISGVIIFSPIKNKSNCNNKFIQNNKIVINRITSINNFNDILANLQEILNSALVMRSLLYKNKSVLFYFDKSYSKEIVNYLIFIIFYKLTDLRPTKLISYSKDNFVFSEDFEVMLEEKLFQ